MGSGGSGKDNVCKHYCFTTIYSSLRLCKFLRVATGLELVEGTKISAIRVSWPELSESDICFVDTPAFDHEKMTDGQIATTISEWSNEMCVASGLSPTAGPILIMMHQI